MKKYEYNVKELQEGFDINKDGILKEFYHRSDMESLSALRNRALRSEIEKSPSIPAWLKDRILSIISKKEARLRAKTHNVLSINCNVVGIISN